MKKCIFTFSWEALVFDTSPPSALMLCETGGYQVQHVRAPASRPTDTLTWKLCREAELGAQWSRTAHEGRQGATPAPVFIPVLNVPYWEDLQQPGGTDPGRKAEAHLFKQRQYSRGGHQCKETEEINIRFLRDKTAGKMHHPKQELVAVTCSLSKRALLAIFLHCDRSKVNFVWWFWWWKVEFLRGFYDFFKGVRITVVNLKRRPLTCSL